MGASAHPRERALNAAAGAMSAAGTCALFNPIDTLKVRWQAIDVRATRATFRAHAARIIMREGLVRGLWAPGLGPNVAFLGAMSSLKIGIYAPCRDALVAASGADGKTAATMFTAGLAAGSISYFVTAPLLLIKTRIVVAVGAGADGRRMSALAEARAIVASGGVRALWMGWPLTVTRGALLSIGHMVGYDAAKTAAIRAGVARDGPVLHGLAGLAAGLAASALQMPADVLITRYQARCACCGVRRCFYPGAEPSPSARAREARDRTRACSSARRTLYDRRGLSCSTAASASCSRGSRR